MPGSPNFPMSEFASRGEQVPRKYWKNLQRLMDNLEVLRAHLGGPTIRVTSGWRSKVHNDDVGGARKSKHLIAQAADIKVAGFSPKEVADAIELLTLLDRMHNGGMGRYENFTHYDVRRRRARWGRN